ncbi:MAG TPA: hypothetical protein VMI55_08710 [Thermoplasmata archaeon]|nr:hypothetical protein [Thermoplasmata archaeon]
MRSATWRTFGMVGLGLVAVFLVLGMSGITGLAAPTSAGHSSATAHQVQAASGIHPAAGPTLGTWVSTAATGPTDVSVLPAWVNFTIAYGGVNSSLFSYDTIISSTNVTVSLVINDLVTGANYLTYAVPIVANTTGYSIMLDQAFLSCSAANCTASMPDTYGYSLYSTLDGTGAQGTTASNATTNFAESQFVDALPTWVNAVAATGPASFSTLPAWVNFTLAYGNVGPSYEVGPGNTSVWFSTLNEVTKTVANYSVPLSLGVTSYSLELTSSGLVGCSQANCTTTFGTMNDTYSFNLWPSIDGTNYRGTFTVNGTLFTPISISSFILFAPSFSVSAPSPTQTVGNITITTNYTAQYLVTAQVNVYTPATLTGGLPVLVFSASALKPAGTTGAVSNKWYEGTPGSYLVSFVAYLSYETVYINGTVTVNSAVQPGGGIIYQNTTIYNNVTGGTSATGFFGLSPAVSGTLFLLVGLIVGILAGLIAARMVMSSGPAKPPQQWSDKKDETTSNTCSVCGKSFGSADELAAHAKSEHGMQ